MSDKDGITPEQAALIDQRIGQTFAFLHDVIDAPTLLEQIPDGAILRFRDVTLERAQLRVRLTAYRAPAMPTWAATVTGFTADDTKIEVGDQLVPTSVTGATPEAALDALEAELRASVDVKPFAY
jgi:hypothetical protein